MRYTNKHNLPEPLAKALMFDDYDSEGDISVTGLIQPPRIRQLLLRHNDEIVRDVIDNFWTMLGKAMHKILEEYAGKEEVLEEQRLKIKVSGWTVTGKPDLWLASGKLIDYKFTSIWVVIFGVKPEHEQQLNMYAYLYRYEGFDIDKLEILVLGRDWSPSKALYDKKYPQQEINALSVPLWSEEKQIAFIKKRVDIHQKAENLSDDSLPDCTAEERWEKPTTWAVMKEGRKSAVRVFNTTGKAVNYIDQLPVKDAAKLNIVKRPGEATRCERYCPVAEFCNRKP